jgi:hypothetical protein
MGKSRKQSKRVYKKKRVRSKKHRTSYKKQVRSKKRRASYKKQMRGGSVFLPPNEMQNKLLASLKPEIFRAAEVGNVDNLKSIIELTKGININDNKYNYMVKVKRSNYYFEDNTPYSLLYKMRSPLFIAIDNGHYNGHYSVIEYLLQTGADTTFITNNTYENKENMIEKDKFKDVLSELVCIVYAGERAHTLTCGGGWTGQSSPTNDQKDKDKNRVDIVKLLINNYLSLKKEFQSESELKSEINNAWNSILKTNPFCSKKITNTTKFFKNLTICASERKDGKYTVCEPGLLTI